MRAEAARTSNAAGSTLVVVVGRARGKADQQPGPGKWSCQAVSLPPVE